MARATQAAVWPASAHNTSSFVNGGNNDQNAVPHASKYEPAAERYKAMACESLSSPPLAKSRAALYAASGDPVERSCADKYKFNARAGLCRTYEKQANSRV